MQIVGAVNRFSVIFSCLLHFCTLARPLVSRQQSNAEKDEAGGSGLADASAEGSHCSPADWGTKNKVFVACLPGGLSL